jgi:hypothetical protein
MRRRRVKLNNGKTQYVVEKVPVRGTIDKNDLASRLQKALN